MSSERLVERRKWFRAFPEGTLEFMVITRVLALLFLIALAVVGGTQRPFVLIGLVGILWVDYVLLLWWVVQVAMDLQCVSEGSEAGDSSDRRVRIGVRAALPSVAAAAALLPWSKLMMVVTGSAVPALTNTLPAVAGVAFCLLLVPAYRALRRVELGAPLWTMLSLVPVVHYFALHRIGQGLDRRIEEQLRARGERPESIHSAAPAFIAADVSWVLSILPWAVIAGIVLVKGWPAGGAFKVGPVCGTVLAAIFAIANLAAMERVQRQITALIRKV